MSIRINNGVSYKSTEVVFMGNTFSILLTEFIENNQIKYISVRKVTNNPYGGLGKEFKDWDAVLANYTSPVMKTLILLAKDKLTK